MTVSAEADFLEALYRAWSSRMAADPQMSIGMLRSMFDEWHQPTKEPEAVTYRSDVVAGVEGIWALPLGADTSRVILYTHGGGFATGSAASHRKLAAHLAKALGTTAFVLDYRRAPEHPFPAQIEDATAVYRALLDRGFAPGSIITAGDSAGGNLAVATVLKLRDDGSPLPGAVIAISPWLDMELAGESLTTNAAADGLVSRQILEGMSAMFLGETGKPDDPLANPLYADYTGFPRLYISAGSAETLLDDATRLADRASAAGAEVTLSVVDRMQHVFPCLAGRAPEADAEIARIGSWYRR
ncbi:alpha/beta hydrolase [Candidatus Mycolicibacterium alkanivorans]|uniref:Alpha/beta hydrolase n=1 Tax=Candidatus Mycolicibacterium alkanivorans TaxID=2954114 RepID=A0ABS9YYY2_9MYCO|nr:alpha/beta hydrolase [Candidatus Mycolicibacterium alkanivorans]MCI4676465.1 alpha/beta hydrolase [Candidatus Mycolicibacterium alkanivorans]